MSIDEMAEQAWHEIDMPVDSKEWKMLKKLSQDDYGIAMDLYQRGFKDGVKFKITGELNGNTL
jgi:hypothetical protein